MRLTIISSLALAAALVLAPPVEAAQGLVQALPGTTDADRLADTMRRLAVSPTDLGALLDAGELSLKVDDLSGAASLFARADKVDPRSARAKAGMAAILVRAERPGEALRYFQQAEALGIQPARVAADRGLAYDLVGDQPRAQRDYRTAIANGADDETLRRYALSLGISGRREQALAVLEPLVRRSDRGAWRARAFILAMTGDVAGASTIATTMMPSGMAQGLQPFFQRLPGLGAADRAFAVHFGEVRATPERLADARLTPVTAPLPPEPEPRVPVAVAAVQPAPAKEDRRSRRDRRRDRDAAVQVAAATPAPAAAAPVAVQARQPAPVPVAAAPRQPAPVALAATTPADQSRAVTATAPRRPTAQPGESVAVSMFGRVPLPPEGGTPARPAQTATSSAAAPVAVVRRDPLPVSMAPTNTGAPAAGTALAPLPGPAESAPFAGTPVTVAASVPTPATSTPVPLASTVPVRVAAPIRSAPRPSAPPPATRPAQDSVLARIIANLSVPAAELDVRPAARKVPSATMAEARAKAAEDSADRRTAVSRLAAAEPVRGVAGRRGTEPADEPETRAGRRSRAAEADDAPATRGRKDDTAATSRRTRNTRDRDASDDDAPSTRSRRGREEVADAAPTGRRGKAAAARKAAADEKAAERKAARAEPERVWVQVATGAREGDLGKAWTNVRGKAPDAFKGRSGYSTPLRATNRVATGPFKTQAEAQAFVNALAKKGVSASTFTSDAGQKVSKLSADK